MFKPKGFFHIRLFYLLFNIYVNDVTRCFKFSKFLMYADDLKIFQSRDAELIQEDLNTLENTVTKTYIKTSRNVTK